jgi:hypothetical protein
MIGIHADWMQQPGFENWSDAMPKVKAARIRCLVVAALLVCLGGCPWSRWALKDPDYAAKYDEAPDPLDVGAQAKQAVDARFVEGKGGWYLGGAGHIDPNALGGEIGIFGYPKSWLAANAGLAVLGGTGADDVFFGVNSALRVQSPSRFSPFAGIGMFHGHSELQVPASDDFIDNDSDGSVDERGETNSEYGWLSAVYPEVGVHYWMNSSVRFTASGAYYVTTEGRASDFWFYGASFSFLSN